ncbi:MAG TPA: CPBP family glutamic-type intramembrane protease [Thermoanaerobaculia bacterium]|nr:CPBP family glutamic-type intramembrane protease [Thermoanaerobaculia bacterium]
MRATLPPAFAPRERAAMLYVALLVWIAGIVALSTLFAPAVHTLVESIVPGRFPYQRVFRRVAMVIALVMLLAGARRLGIRSLADCGLGLARDRLREALAWGAIGGGALAALFVVELVLGTRVVGSSLGVAAALETLVGAVLVGLVEEGLCRGAMLFPFGRLRGWALWSGVAATSAVYATAHFARGSGRQDTADWGAGLRIWETVARGTVEHGEAWWGLFLTGALLYVVAYRQGHAWGAVGLHMGSMLALQWGGALTDPTAGNRSLLLVDGLLPGYGVAAASLVTLVAVMRLPGPR